MSIPSSIEVVTPPAGECVTVEELKLQTRVDSGEEDALLAGYVSAAREAFEAATDGRIILPTTLRERFSGWGHLGGCNPPWAYGRTLPLHLRLARAKVTAVTCVAYYDIDDVQQTLAGYEADATGTPCVLAAPAAGWPVLSGRRLRPVSVTYTAGWPDAASVPASIKLAIKSLAAHWYWTREAYGEADLKAVPMSFADFCRQWSTGLGGW